MVLGGATLYVLVSVHADSTLIAMTANVLGLSFLAKIWSVNSNTKQEIEKLHDKTDTIIHQTNSDLDRRMQEQSEYVIKTVERMLEHDAKSNVSMQRTRKRIPRTLR